MDQNRRAGRNRQPICAPCRPSLRPMFTSDSACFSLNNSTINNLSMFFCDPASTPTTSQSPPRSPTTFPLLFQSPKQNTTFFSTSVLTAQNSSDPNTTVLTSSNSVGLFYPDSIIPSTVDSTIAFPNVTIPVSLIGFSDYQVSLPAVLSSLITNPLSSSGQWSATIEATNQSGESCILTNPAYNFENGLINFFSVETTFPVNPSPCTFLINITIDTSSQ